MTAVQDVSKQFADALASGDADVVGGLGDHLTEKVAMRGPMGVNAGRDEVLGGLANPMLLGMLQQATWSADTVDDATGRVRAAMPPSAIFGGFDYVLTFDDEGRISDIEQQALPAAALVPEPIVLGDDVRDLLANAHANGMAPFVAYVGPDGRPHMSLRATTQVLTPDTLGMWIRDPAGGLLKGIAENPNLNIWYRDPVAHLNYQFFGRARRDDSDATREQVYDGSPEAEQAFDLDRQGVAVVIELDRVEGNGPGGRFLMVRGS